MSALTAEADTDTRTMPEVWSRGERVAPENLKPMVDSGDALHDPETLRERMARDGYLYVPGMLDRAEVLAGRRSVMEKLAEGGFIKPGTDPIAGIYNPGSGNLGFRPDLAEGDGALNRVLYEGPMIRFFERYFEAEVLSFNFTWLRPVSPGPANASHCDVVYMGRGTTEKLFTVWTPFGDIDHAVGGLMILERSHLHEGLRNSYGQYDVDTYCTNRPHITGWKRGGNLTAGPNQLASSLGCRWAVTEFSAGDALIFTMHTVHAGLDNRSERIRLSTDTRYQPAHLPADERWVGPNPIAHSQAGKRGRIC